MPAEVLPRLRRIRSMLKEGKRRDIATEMDKLIAELGTAKPATPAAEPIPGFMDTPARSYTAEQVVAMFSPWAVVLGRQEREINELRKTAERSRRMPAPLSPSLDKCPLCGWPVEQCAQGEYCTNKNCKYLA